MAGGPAGKATSAPAPAPWPYCPIRIVALAVLNNMSLIAGNAVVGEMCLPRDPKDFCCFYNTPLRHVEGLGIRSPLSTLFSPHSLVHDHVRTLKLTISTPDSFSRRPLILIAADSLIPSASRPWIYFLQDAFHIISGLCRPRWQCPRLLAHGVPRSCRPRTS